MFQTADHHVDKGVFMRNRVSLVSLFIVPSLFLFCVSSFVSADGYSGGVQARVILKTKNMSNGQSITYARSDNPEVTVMTVEFSPRG